MPNKKDYKISFLRAFWLITRKKIKNKQIKKIYYKNINPIVCLKNVAFYYNHNILWRNLFSNVINDLLHFRLLSILLFFQCFAFPLVLCLWWRGQEIYKMCSRLSSLIDQRLFTFCIYFCVYMHYTTIKMYAIRINFGVWRQKQNANEIKLRIMNLQHLHHTLLYSINKQLYNVRKIHRKCSKRNKR